MSATDAASMPAGSPRAPHHGDPATTYVTAKRAGLVSCHACGRVAAARITLDYAAALRALRRHAALAQSRQHRAHVGAADHRRDPLHSGEPVP